METETKEQTKTEQEKQDVDTTEELKPIKPKRRTEPTCTLPIMKGT